MNLSEFKAWFEGFTENLDGTAPPNARQWKRIKEKIGKIEDAPPVTQHVFHDYYYRPWKRYYYDTPTWVSYSVGASHLPSTAQALTATSLAAPTLNVSNNSVGMANEQIIGNSFDSGAAFRELGRAEARSMRKGTEESV